MSDVLEMMTFSSLSHVLGCGLGEFQPGLGKMVREGGGGVGRWLWSVGSRTQQS